MHRGFVKVYRRILEVDFYTKQSLKATFLHCLLKAVYKPQTVMVSNKRVHLKPGQFVTSIREFAKETGLRCSTVNRNLKRLSYNNLTLVKTEHQYTLITVINWDTYQGYQEKVKQGWNTPETHSAVIPLPVRDSDCVKKVKKDKNIYIVSKESLTAFLHTHNLPLRVKEPVTLFIDKIRQSGKSKRISQSRIEKIVQELLAMSGKYGEGNLLTAIDRTLAREGFNWGSRNVTGYVKAIAKSLFEQDSQGRVEQQSEAEKKALSKAEGSKLYQDIKEEFNNE